MSGDTLVTSGGRVLGVTGVAPTLSAARDRAYEACALISWPGMQYRTDIAEADAALLCHVHQRSGAEVRS
jgi:phosphoribosylamine--glycine ligase